MEEVNRLSYQLEEETEKLRVAMQNTVTMEEMRVTMEAMKDEIQVLTKANATTISSFLVAAVVLVAAFCFLSSVRV